MLQVETEVTMPHTKAPCCDGPQSDGNQQAMAHIMNTSTTTPMERTEVHRLTAPPSWPRSIV